MSCNSCAKSFSLLRKEKGCPACGFSYCSKCLDNKLFVPKLNSEAKVCAKCKQSNTTSANQTHFEPPDAYYKRMAAMQEKVKQTGNVQDEQILHRLNKLKKDNISPAPSSNEEIARRLQNIRGEIPSTSDAEIGERLAKLRGQPVIATKHSFTIDTRHEQQQVDDLLRQYMEQSKIDLEYKDEFDSIINNIASRMQKLKGDTAKSEQNQNASKSPALEDEEAVNKIVEKVKAEALLEKDEISPSTNDELPFCEICNEDATMRCLGCKYLFCKRCFIDHRDDDDGCNRFEPYSPPKGMQY